MAVYDSIINELQRLECVDDVFWDKCQAKALLYPGKSAIGVRCKTNTGIVEKCFIIQLVGDQKYLNQSKNSSTKELMTAKALLRTRKKIVR